MRGKYLTYPRHSWPLSSEGSFAYTPTVTRYIRLLWCSASTCDTHIWCRASCSGVATTYTLFYYLGLSRLGFEHQYFRLILILNWECLTKFEPKIQFIFSVKYYHIMLNKNLFVRWFVTYIDCQIMKVLTRRKETSMNKHLIVIYDNIQRILTLFSL